MSVLDFKTKCCLLDLEQQGHLKLSKNFGGSNVMDMETDLNRIILDKFSEEKGEKIRLACKTVHGSDVKGWIRFRDLDHYRAVVSYLDQVVGKSIDYIYRDKAIGITNYEAPRVE